MRRTILTTAAAAGLLVSTAFVSAQTVIELSPEDETTIYTTVTRERVRTAPPPGLSVSIGAELPREVELYEVPSTLRVEGARTYRYTVVDDRVVLVDPGTRKVVRVIQRR